MLHSSKYESLTTGQKVVAEPIALYLYNQRLCRYPGSLSDAYTDAAH